MNKLNNYLIYKNENAIFYECEYSTDNAIFFKIQNDKFFITDSRYEYEAKNSLHNSVNLVISNDLISKTAQILNENKIKNIVFDGNQISFNAFSKLKSLTKTNFINEPDFSMKKRVIKTNEEIENIKKAIICNTVNLSNFINSNGIGLNEKELYFEACNIFSQKGLYDLSFNPIVAINGNASKPHAIPTNKCLEYEDLMLVFGVKYNRHCSDKTRTAFLNKENFKLRKSEFFR